MAPPQTLLFRNAFLVFVGASIPSIVVGRSAIGIALIIAVLCVPYLSNRSDIWALFKKSIITSSGCLILLLFVAWLPSMIYTPEVTTSVQTIVRSLLFVVISLFIWATLVINKESIDLCLKVVALISLFLMGLAILELEGISEIIRIIRGHGDDGHHTDKMLKEAATSSAIMLPQLIWISYRLKGVWVFVCLLAVLEIFWLIDLTINRSAMVGILAAFLVVGLIWISHMKSNRLRLVLLFAVISSCMIILAAFRDYIFHIPYFAGDFDDLLLPYWLIDPQRQAIWSFAWQSGEQYRWLGFGINAIDKLPAAAVWNLGTGTRNIPLHPHNWVIEIVVETGLIGLIAMLITISYFLLRWVRQYMVSGDPALLAVLGVWAAYWSSSLFSVSYWSAWLQATFLITTTICLACRRTQPKLCIHQ